MAAVIPVGAEGTSLPLGTSPVEGIEEGFGAGGALESKREKEWREVSENEHYDSEIVVEGLVKISKFTAEQGY